MAEVVPKHVCRRVNGGAGLQCGCAPDYCARDAMPGAIPGRRVRMPLSSGYMDVNVSEGASPETLEALRRVGEAAVELMKEGE